MAQVDIKAAWTLPDDVVDADVAIYYRTTSYPTTWKHLDVFSGQETTLDDLFVGFGYEVAAALVDSDGNVQPEKYWAVEKITPKGSTDDALPAPTNLGATQDGEYVEAKWDSMKEKMAHFNLYEVRVGTSWSDSRRVDYAGTPKLRWKWETAGAITIRVATLDVYGKRSAETTFAITIQALDNFEDGATEDEDTAWGGTKTDTEISSGDLILSVWGNPANTATEQADTATWLSWGKEYGSYNTGEVDLGSIRNVRLELDMTAADDEASHTADEAIVPARNTVDHENGTLRDPTDLSENFAFGDAIAAGDEKPNDVRVFIKFGDTSPISMAYQPYIPGFYSCRYYRIWVQMWQWNRWKLLKLSRLRILERKRNLKEEGVLAVTGSPGPTNINFTANFIDTPSVVAVSDQAGFFVQITSPSASSADAKVYDNDGTEVFTGNIYWIAAGT